MPPFTIQITMMTTPKPPLHHHHPASCHALDDNMKMAMKMTQPTVATANTITMENILP